MKFLASVLGPILLNMAPGSSRLRNPPLETQFQNQLASVILNLILFSYHLPLLPGIVAVLVYTDFKRGPKH